MLPTERALALVVRGTDWSETSRIATLWTREFGKIRALAKGGRRLRSNFEVAFDLLSVCHIVFIRKSGGLDLLIEAQVAERFGHLRTDLQALYAGYYVAELLEKTQEYDPHPVLFDAALETIRAFGQPPVDQPGRVSAFELVWLRELGYMPRLETCAACERKLATLVNADDRLGFSAVVGGVLCPECRATNRDHRPLSPRAWNGLRAIANGEPTLPSAVRREVRQTLGHTVSYVLGHRPRLLGYLDGS